MGLVSDGFIIDPPACLPLFLHGLLWEFPNKQATQGGCFLILQRFLGITPSWIVWGGIWCRNGSACGAKTRAPYNPVPKIPWLTTSWPCTTSWYRLLLHLWPPTPSWRGFGMLSWLELGGLLLPPWSCIETKYKFSRCLPTELPWWDHIEWWICMDTTLSSISWCILRLGTPCNSPSWKRKVLIGHYNRVPRSVTR